MLKDEENHQRKKKLLTNNRKNVGKKIQRNILNMIEKEVLKEMRRIEKK
jgi:hypothetical protein